MAALIKKYFDGLPATGGYELSPFEANHYPDTQQNFYDK